MASTSASSVQKSFRYDVFISFSGKDTRRNFVDHLYHALCNRGITTYKDNERIEKGKEISDQLIRAIEESRFHIIVFSKNYASSSWCLEELVKIMECQKMTEYTAYPVFYDVEPTEVRHQSGTVGVAFSRHEKWSWSSLLPLDRLCAIIASCCNGSFSLNGLTRLEKEEDFGRWRNAMKEAADLAGMELKETSNGHEAKFIEKLIEDISPKLHFINLRIDENLVGMEIRVKKIISSLETGSIDVCMIGIKGIGGGGKTTLARVVFDHITFQFEGKSFVENVREGSKGFGLKELQKQVLQDVLNDKNIDVKSVYDGKDMMKKTMPGRKVLVVLDDADDADQIEALVGKPCWFGRGSIIIITTRDEQVLKAHRVSRIHDVNLLSREEAICLFSRYAFGRESPSQGYEELSNEVIHYADGLPLTIKVLGSHLCGRNEREWENALERLKTIPLKETLEKLELSYNGLENDHKEIFLDVACILKGMEKQIAIRILESCGLHAEHGLRVLEQKSLLTISDYERLQMHDHLEEMGKNIVRRLHPGDPNKHSRLWIREEIDDILVNDLGTDATKSIRLDGSQSSSDISMIMKGLRKMEELRTLCVDYNYFQDISDPVDQYLPNTLRSICWFGYPFTCLPTTFQAKQLVHLQISYSKIARLWEGGVRKILPNLKFFVLEHSNFISFDMEMTPNLQILCIGGCWNFVELIMPTECLKLKILKIGNSKVRSLNIGSAPCLEKLNLANCRDLVELHMPVEFPKLKFLKLHNTKVLSLSIGSAPCIEKLNLAYCTDLVELHIPVECPRLKFLELPNSKVSSLNIGSSQCLEKLNLAYCNHLVELHMPVEYPKLKFLELSNSKVNSLNIRSTLCLETLNLANCIDLVELHMPIECPKLKFFELSGSKVSNLIIGSAPYLETLDLANCKDLVKLDLLVELPKLEFLNLSGSKVTSFNMGMTPELKMLNLGGCCDIVELRMPVECPKLEELHLRGCNWFVELPISVECPNLKFLNLSDSKVSNINLELTPHLERLDLKNCYFLQEIKDPVGCLKKLVYFNLSGCSRFEYFLAAKGDNLTDLDSVATMLNLTAESLNTCPLHPESNLPKFQFTCFYDEDLPSSSGNLEKLLSLGLCACTNLESFSARICGLQHLKILTLEGGFPEVPKDLYRLESLEHLTLTMKEIKYLPGCICMLKHLKSLNLRYCEFLEQLPNDIGRLEGLEELHLTDCISLQGIPNSICNMNRLKYLDLHFCIMVEKLPEEFGLLENLEEINIEGAGIRHLPQSMFQLKGLYIVGSTWRLESFGFTSLKEISTYTASCYIRDSQHESPL